ncbi:MAG: phasin family protein [Chloroflexota bacterium]|nr:phasin family protein [Chloroflexota bacterium]
MADNKQSDIQATTSAASRSSTQAAHEVSRQSAEAAQQSGRAISDAMRRNGEATAEAARRGREAGAEAMQRVGDATGEGLRRGVQAVAESQHQILQNAAEQFEQVNHKVAQAFEGTTENVRTLMGLPNAANGGLQDLQQSMTGLIEGVVRTNLQMTQELFRLANPSAFIELQQRFVRDYLDALIEGSATLIRATRRTADETLRPLEVQIEHRQQARRGEHGHANAAE